MKREPSITSLLALAGVAYLSVPACASKGGTTLVVSVFSDLPVGSEIDEIDIVVADGELRYPFALGSGSGRTGIPVHVALVPGGETDQQFRVQAIGFLLGTQVVSQSAALSFVPGTRQEIVLFLDRACAIVPPCGLGFTCDMGSCTPEGMVGIQRPFLGLDAGADIPSDRSVEIDSDAKTSSGRGGTGGTTTSGTGGSLSETGGATTGGGGGTGDVGLGDVGTGGPGTGGRDADGSIADLIDGSSGDSDDSNGIMDTGDMSASDGVSGTGGASGTGPCVGVAAWSAAAAATYQAGDEIVDGSPPHLFRCKDYPASGYCQLTGYEPSDPSGYWRDAWDDLGPCN